MSMSRHGAAIWLTVLSACLLSACAPVGPDYVRPASIVSPVFTETGPWSIAAPQDDVGRGDWWTVFADPVLNEFQDQAVKQNPDLLAVAWRVRQAQAITGVSSSYLFPEINFGLVDGRSGISPNSSSDSPNIPSNVNHGYMPTLTANGIAGVPIYANYEIDFWGRIRRQIEASQARLDSSVAAYQTALLTLTGDVAQTYFELRTTDELLRILEENITLRQTARDLVFARRRDGLASDLDLAYVDTELQTTQAELKGIQNSRTQLLYKLAVLVGRQAEGFTIARQPFKLVTPVIPVGLPSDLLQRRPDIAAAERNMVAYNAEIGVAKAAYFPTIQLTGALGFNTSDLSTLANGTSSVWTVGASLFQQIFNAGRIGLNVDRTRAVYQERVAVYQGVLLRAFQEVESSLAGLRFLSGQAVYQNDAVKSADRATFLATKRYRAGLVSLMDVVIAQRASLAAEREAVQISNKQLLTSVALIKALGGGWQVRLQAITPAIVSDRGS